jgi:hypothetical protein
LPPRLSGSAKANNATGSTRTAKRHCMIHDLLHQLFQVHYIHEVLHLLSGCVGSFIGTWAYFAFFQKRLKGSARQEES